MTPVVISTELTDQDWREARQFIQRRWLDLKASRRDRVLGSVGVAILVFLFGVLSRANGKNTGSMLLAGVVLGLCAYALTHWFRAGRFAAIQPRLFYGPVRYELDEQGLRSIRPDMRGFADWKVIEKIDETATAVYLVCDLYTSYPIPKRSIDPANVAAVVAQLRAWHAERTRTSLEATEVRESEPPSASVTAPEQSTPELAPSRAGFLRGLLGNLRAGFRLLTFRRVAASDFAISFEQLGALVILIGALLLAADWLSADDGSIFDAYGFYAWACYAVAGLAACALVARFRTGDARDTRSLLVVWLSSLPTFALVSAILLTLPLPDSVVWIVVAAFWILLMATSERAVIAVFGHRRLISTVLVTLAVIGVPYVFQLQFHLDPHLWYLPDTEADAPDDNRDAGDAESLLFDQQNRIADAVDKIAPQRPGVVDTFFVGFAGDGEQRIFRNEALFAESVFAKKFGSGERSLELINDERDRDTYPLATVTGLRSALGLIGDRMNKDEDVLVLLLTSHGSHESGIYVKNGGLPLVDLQPEDVRSALDDAGIKWRVVIVSACYAGIFIEPLQSANTLVITAADADHTSFGCADDRELTYFGEAFLRDALPGAPSIEAAYEKAKNLIAARERAEKLTPSHPQLSAGDAIRRKLMSPATTGSTAAPSGRATRDGYSLTASIFQ